MSKKLIVTTILNSYYNIKLDENYIIYINDSYYFYYGNELYMLKKILKIQKLDIINNYFSKYINNIFNNYVTLYNGMAYILSKNNKHGFSIDNVIILNIQKSYYQKCYYFYVLRKRLVSFEKYISLKGKNIKILAYFTSLSSIILNYIKITSNQLVRYGLVCGPIVDYSYILKACFLCNYRNEPIVISLSNYIKYYYFEKNEFCFIDIFKSYYFNKDELILFYCSLLYPTYIFNTFHKEFDQFKYEEILNKVPKYFSFVNLIYLYIKKRYIDIPYINL